jgi:hypothetical protein
MEEQILELTRQVTILNERLPNHITWTERNVLDHEKRIRILEQFRWTIVGVAIASGGVGAALAKLLGA